MDGSARAAGIGPTIKLNGRDFIVRGRNQEFSALIEGEILKVRGNPTKLIVEAAREMIQSGDKDASVMVDMVASSVAEKFRNWKFVSYSDYGEFMRTPRGDAFQVWFAIRRDAGKDVTLDKVQHWLRELRWLTEVGENGELVRTGEALHGEIMQAIDFASGDDELGNETGQ